MMDDKVRMVLRDLVAEKGESLLGSRERLRGLLSDDCPECTKEINVLMIAVQAQVAAEMRAYSSSTETRVAVNASILRLERAFGLGRPAAAWAVLSLGYALSRITEEQFQTLLPELSADSAVPPAPNRPASDPMRPPPPPPPPPVFRPPPPPPPPPRPISQPFSQPGSQPYVSPVYQPVQPYPNVNPVVSPPGPQAGSMPLPIPVQPTQSSSSRVGIGIGIGIGVLLVASVLFSLAHRSPAPDTTSTGSQTSQSAPSQSQPSRSQPPASDPPVAQPSAQSGFTTYADKSGLFQVDVPADWVFLRSESDTTLDNAACHMVRAAVFAKVAEHSDLDGWLSEGIRVTVYLPPSGQIWQTEWAADWLKRSINGTLQGYAKYQNTTVEPVQLGNVAASTTAVMGEAKAISEPEVARLYVGVAQKYLVVVDVAMPSSKRPLFESADETVRRTFKLNVP